jgi:hypothetical protein
LAENIVKFLSELLPLGESEKIRDYALIAALRLTV